MKWLACLIGTFSVVLLLTACSQSTEETSEQAKVRILIFSKTAGFRHKSINVGKAAIASLASDNGIIAETSEDSAVFEQSNLERFSAVVFLNTTGDILTAFQQAEFERFIQAGGGYVGVHAATDTEYRWPWYGKLVGAYFAGHPKQQQATIDVVDRTHVSTQHLQEQWVRFDEWYNFKSLNEDVTVLATLDESTYKGGKNGDHHPIAWYHEFDGGRAFYTGGGHTDKSYSEPEFMQHLLGGILYSIGDATPLDYSKARSKLAPTDNRFTKKVLDTNLNEPMELEVLDDGRVMFVERRGAVRLYDPKVNRTSQVGVIPVAYQKEDGLLGLALDPDFSKNGWIYFYYSPIGEETIQHLSRITFSGGKLELDSEKIILKVPVQRGEACCHAGGSLEFGPNGHLFISTGDNTNPFASKGYSPVDQRPGRLSWDAQRSAGNTNDLRGKILRIHPEDDGSYSIPAGNLFAPGTAGTRPEIYTMGNRNPFRISIDQRTGYLYWGEVGPDAGKDNENFGPRGFDEINQARTPGFFGWPYFIADNKPYQKYDFVNDKIGQGYNDPKNPENTSPNNTGQQKLPPPNPAFIWYPAAESKEFPEVGKGGRTAMAGPVYYSDDFGSSATKFPDYFDGKLFIYEWSRNWIKVVSMDDNGQFSAIEPFMPEDQFSKPMDMQFANDGTLYLLEYGSAWNKQNEDSKLVQFKYIRGNRAPLARLDVSAMNGAAPLDVEFSAENSIDYDRDLLSYVWTINGELATKNATFSHRFDKPGNNVVELSVVDAHGIASTESITIAVGNEKPKVSVNVKSRNGNTQFFWPTVPIDYDVQVSDKEDGSLLDGGIKASDVLLSYEFVPDGKVLDPKEGQMGEVLLRHAAGLEHINDGGCKACHAVDQQSIGPSFAAVAKRYDSVDDHTREQLIQKIQQGGKGNWGEQAMPANPQSKDVVAKMLDYILSQGKPIERLTLDGHLLPAEGGTEHNLGAYIVKLSYEDRGGDAPPLKAYQQAVLRNTLPAHTADAVHKARKGADFVGWMQHGAYIRFNDIDVTGIKQIRYLYSTKSRNGRIEARLGAPDGQLLGVVKFPASGSWKKLASISANLESVNGRYDIYFVFSKEDSGPNEHLINMKSIQFLPDL
jgi:cytochrome c